MPYLINADDVPLVAGLRAEEGWIDMRVQFLLDEASAGTSRLVLGRTVLPPGARHERHRHPGAGEFLFVASGSGAIYTDQGDRPARPGDVVYTPAGEWHGFNNTSPGEVILIWGWDGAGSREAAGYEVAP